MHYSIQEQRRESGNKKFSSGLTEEEQTLRAARDEARANFATGANLVRRLELDEGKGKPKGKGKHDHYLRPIAWANLSEWDRWYVREFRNGNLWRAKNHAEAEYNPRTADTNLFQVDERGATEHSDKAKR